MSKMNVKVSRLTLIASLTAVLAEHTAMEEEWTKWNKEVESHRNKLVSHAASLKTSLKSMSLSEIAKKYRGADFSVHMGGQIIHLQIIVPHFSPHPTFNPKKYPNLAKHLNADGNPCPPRGNAIREIRNALSILKLSTEESIRLSIIGNAAQYLS